MFRYAESSLKPTQSLKQEHFHFTCHCWISDDRLLAGTDQGKLLLIQNSEILHEIKLDHRSDPKYERIDSMSSIVMIYLSNILDQH
jgi:hypothetical protein